MKTTFINNRGEFAFGFRYFAGAFTFRLGPWGVMVDFKPVDAFA